ncbi:MAG: O-methyltransferase [Promethearchaeota archaeon]|jgi:predicted O-methyltransferase YrrM
MKFLEEIDKKDRADDTPRLKRLRQIPPETGKFISILAASAPIGEYIEIGTSTGYSTMWLSLACKIKGVKITTFEILEEKIKLAKKTFIETNLGNYIQLIEGDARDYLKNYTNIAFCFLDAEKEIYEECYDLVIPNMVKGGILTADNAINHYDTLRPMLEKAFSDVRIDALVVPIGKGVLLCRKL